MRVKYLKNGFAFGIVLLFLMIGASPIINADGNAIPQSIDDVSITILECKADGTVERTVFRMSSEQAESFHEEMGNALDLEMRLSIYKKYNLISQDITVDSLREGMEERAQEMGLTQDGLMSKFRSSQSLLPPFIRRNIFCYVNGREDVWYGFCFPPIFTGFSRHLGLLFLISGCSIESKGLLGEFNFFTGFFVKLIGFVGIIEVGSRNSWRWIQYDGFCIYCKALGVPE